MRRPRPAGASRPRLAATLVLLATVTAGCGDDADGPLQLAGYGNVLDGLDAADRPPYFTVSMCLEADDNEITITDVSAVGLQGTSEPLQFAVAWPDGPDYEKAISSHEPLPDAYVDANDAEGRVGECGDTDSYADLAVVFPPVGGRPISLEGIEVDYMIDGDDYTKVEGELFLAQCPAGTRPRVGVQVEEAEMKPLCRKVRSAR